MSSISSVPKEKEMGIWNEEILDEKEEIVTVKYLPFRIKIYNTEKQKEGIRIPLDQNNELLNQFKIYLSDLKRKNKLSPREEKFDLVRFSTFAENDISGLQTFQMVGFYYLNGHIIFAVEPDSPKPLKRFQVWVEYYKEMFNVTSSPDEDFFKNLGKLDISDEEDE